MTKPRPDDKLTPFRAEIFPRMKSGESYHKIRRWLEKEHGVHTSNAALSNAWNKWSREDLEERVIKSKGLAADVMDLIDNPEQLDDALALAMKQSAFELVMQGGDPKTIRSFCTILLNSEKLKHDQAALELQVDRFQFDAAKAAMQHAAELKVIAADKGMSNDAKIDAVRRRLFGAIPEDSNG